MKGKFMKKKIDYIDELEDMLDFINETIINYISMTSCIDDKTKSKIVTRLPSYFDIFKYEDIRDCHKHYLNIYNKAKDLNNKLNLYGKDNIKRMILLAVGQTFEEVELLEKLYKNVKKEYFKKHYILTKKYLKDNNISIKKERGVPLDQ